MKYRKGAPAHAPLLGLSDGAANGITEWGLIYIRLRFW